MGGTFRETMRILRAPYSNAAQATNDPHFLQARDLP
jgi:hypothetical protein